MGMIVTAYQANDGKLFSVENKSKYIKHLKKLATERRFDRKLTKFRAKEQEFWAAEFWNKVRSIEQLEAAIFKHAEFLGYNALNKSSFYNEKRPPGPPIIKTMKLDLNCSSFVSNSHSCPVTGKTNWSGDVPDVPCGYPGLSGRIEYGVEWYCDWSGYYPGSSAMWKGSRIHTGSGGGGQFTPYSKNDSKGLQKFGFGISIFLDDWPGLKYAYEKAMIIGPLKYGSEFNINSLMNEMNPAEEYMNQ